MSLNNSCLRSRAASEDAAWKGRVQFSASGRCQSLVGSLLFFWLSASGAAANLAGSKGQLAAPQTRRTLPPSAYQFQPGLGTDVPNLRGHSRDEVPRILEGARLKLGNVTEAFSEDPVGQVTAQSPEAGEHIARGRQVDVTISRGSDLLPVPNVIGQTLETAKQSLADAGLNIIAVGKKESDQTVVTVADQKPPAGTRVHRGSRVEVMIAVPVAKVPVPDLLGLTEDAALQRLTEAGLAEGGREERRSKDPAGTIVGQSPAAGQMVPRGSPVGRIVAAAAEFSIVPNLVGQSVYEAERLLVGVGLRLGRQQEVKSEEPSGQILRQKPSPHAHVPPGSSVDVLVSFSAWVMVPDLSGLGNDPARQTLSQNGLVLGAVRQEVSVLPAGTVLRQVPGAGSRVRRGTRVDVWTASARAEPPWLAISVAAGVVGLVAAGVYRNMVKRRKNGRRDKSPPQLEIRAVRDEGTQRLPNGSARGIRIGLVMHADPGGHQRIRVDDA